MLLTMMVLFSSVTVSEVSLDASIFDGVQDEWIAPGYRIAEEMIIDPLDYGVPQNDREGNPKIIGFQSFFVQTSEGEKWRIILTYDKKVVVLQEDAELREFEVERSIKYMINSKDGRFVLLRFQEEIQTRQEIAIEGLNPPKHRSVLINIETGTQVTGSGIAGIGYLGDNGYGIASYGDSIRFYDENLNLVKRVFNKIANVSNGATSYAADGSLMVTIFGESYEGFENGSYSLRAYDQNGKVLWDAFPPNTGRSAISEDGSLVLIIGINSLMCLDGSDGSLLWEEPYENNCGISSAARNAAACCFATDLSLDEVRENPSRERALYVSTVDSDGNGKVNKISFYSRSIAFFSPIVLNSTGASLWKIYIGQRIYLDLSKYELCLFSREGDLRFVHRIEGDGYVRNLHWRNTMDLKPSSINSTGNKIIWFEDSVIHILTIEKNVVSE